MRIAVVGQGGREHALAWRLRREGYDVVGVPGNAGIRDIAACVSVSLADVPATVRACVEARVELVVVGPEAPLAAGLADALRAAGVPVFGPSAAAARIEASKAFAKEIMRRAAVPTARWSVASSEAEAAEAIRRFAGRCAVKADGLAAGKGVVVCGTEAEALGAARMLLGSGSVVVEERLEGPEVSVIALTDGRACVLLPPARDHKRLRDGDEGPNTGGMGAVCPVDVPPGLLDDVRESVVRPVLRALVDAGAPFSGALYVGLMLTPDGPRVLEFNARFGDPETQAIVTALGDDVRLGEILAACATGGLHDRTLTTAQASCCIVLASGGYPERPRSGDVIEGAESVGDALVFHAGTRLEHGRLVTAGGRVLNVAATAPTLDEARGRALEAAQAIRFDGMQLRTDIGGSRNA